MSKTKSSHPKSLRKTVSDNLKKANVKGKHLLIGVSGGSDSMALLHVLSGLRESLGFSLSAVGVHHGLRPEAQLELDIASKLAEERSVDWYQKNIKLEPGGNIQERAREARYSAIRELQEEIKADYIVMAHHMEDRAETILMRIIKGSVYQNIENVMPLLTDHGVLRPMITAYKRDVVLHIERKQVPYMDDPSNFLTEKYFRVKVRQELIPYLKDINPNIIDAMCKLSDSLSNIK
jgi:tRNA(Ile)-lysidine synthase